MFSAIDLWTWTHEIWHIIFAGLTFLLSVVAAGHAVLYKRDSRAAIAWVGFIWLLPLLGAVLYFLFGVNRLRREAALLRRDMNELEVSLKRDMREMEQRMTIKLGGLMVVAVGAVATLVKLL